MKKIIQNYIRENRGFSMIEVLISMLLLSFILLGLDAMETYSIQKSRSAYFFNMAITQLNNMTEKLKAIMNGSDLAGQLEKWNQENQAVLPQGLGTVTGTFPDFIVTIYWGQTPHHCALVHVGESGCLKEKINLL
jgi:type IV pilus assembly protein PilV